jgi:hypothetical protein
MSSSGLALALRLLEANKLSVTHDALFETFGSAVAELVEKGFWLRTGSANEATIHDDDGQPTNVDWDEDRREFGYYKAAEGWTPIDPARLDCYEPDIDRLLDCLLDRKLRKPVGGIFKVDDQGFAWEVGTLRLTRRGPTSVWFVRCLRDLVAASEITAAAAARPASGLRLLLTSSSRAAAQSIRIPSATIVSIADILSTDDHPRIDMATLKARLMGSTAEPVTEPVHLADDGSVLTLLGQIEISFRGSMQVAGIRYMVSEHRKGNRVRAADVLCAAGSNAGQLDKLFRSQWPTLKQYYKSRNGLWGFDL